MCLEATDLAAKRLLIGSIGSIYIMTHAALLRGIGTLDFSCLYPSLASIPGNLLRDMREIGGTHVGIHSASFVLHRGNRQVLISELSNRMLSKALVDGAVDLLAYMTESSVARSGYWWRAG